MSCGSEDPQRRSGNEVGLEIEGVVALSAEMSPAVRRVGVGDGRRSEHGRLTRTTRGAVGAIELAGLRGTGPVDHHQGQRS